MFSSYIGTGNLSMRGDGNHSLPVELLDYKNNDHFLAIAYLP